MIDLGILITGGIGLITTIVSGWTSWFFARKKYNTEVDQNIIYNMKESLDFYKQLSDDNRSRLEEVLSRNEELEKRNDRLEEEVKKLRDQMFVLMNQICLDLTCKIRQNGTNSRQKVEETKLHNK